MERENLSLRCEGSGRRLGRDREGRIASRPQARSFHGLLDPGSSPSLGNSAKAFSTFARIQTLRLLISFGGGIRPSLTIWSNRTGLIPTYSAATTLERPTRS